MRRVSAFIRRHLLVILGALVLLAVVVVVWIFFAPIAPWLRSAQSFDAVAFLGEHLPTVAIVGGCLLILALIWIPKWQAARPELTSQARFEVENNARKTLAEILGGAAVLIGLFFAWQNLKITQEATKTAQETTAQNLEIARGTLNISQEGQVTERFTKAIDQLGAVNDKGEKQLEVRLGGIYALERIARDSERDHWPIMEVLTAYVRENAPRVSKEAQLPKGDRLPWKAPPPTLSLPLPRLAADIQAVLTVLGRRTLTYEKGEKQYLNLTKTDLRGADLQGALLNGAQLPGAQLDGVNLSKAQLKKANLNQVELRDANLKDAQLMEAVLWGGHLERVNFIQANLNNANLEFAQLQGAHFLAAHLRETDFVGAWLKGADFSAAQMERVILVDTQLEGARFIGAQLSGANFQGAKMEGAFLILANLRGATDLTVEQLSTVQTLYQAAIDQPLMEQVQRLYPQLLELPREWR